jgi:hypothetical protein
MAEYRVYFVGCDDHFKAAETIHCATDDEAVDTAIAGIGGFTAVEVWCGGRSLGRIAPQEAYPE